MTAQAVPVADPIRDAPDPVTAAREHVAAIALRDGAVERVGLELEMHLVDLAEPTRRPAWPVVQRVLAALPPLPGGCAVTVEPGGQVELSTPATLGVGAAIDALRTDRQVLARTLAGLGLGAAPLGTDPAREPARTNPSARYAAMQRHFEAVGTGVAGLQMMTATAALQVNLDAGPTTGWADRLAHLRRLLPVLAAISATSSHLGGRSSGWHSMRQQVWAGLDPRRAGPVAAGSSSPDWPARWAEHALAAPVMMTREAGVELPTTRCLPFAAWLRRPELLGRPATSADLDHHLTTLFPPLRPRGYLELRCLDALPDRWWPAVAALVVTLADDPVAADLAADACAPLDDSATLELAARDGLASPALRAAVRACTDIAARHAPPGLEGQLARLAELATDGRGVGEELRTRAETVGPARLLEEEARA
jgi:glutamate--cysteine ligase